MEKKLFNDFRILFLFFLFTATSCARENIQEKTSLINSTHLDFLYQEVNIDGKDMAIIHIYSNYPEYEWIGDDDEGIACVDDVARAAIFYLELFKVTNDSESLIKAKKLLEFVLHMQAENGFFYNFIWDDHSINKTFKTSVAEPDWWSWRALWVLMDGYEIIKNEDPSFAERLLASAEKTIGAIKTIIPEKYETRLIDAIEKPTWLPYETATDQSAILLLGLLPYYSQTNDQIILQYIKKLCEGILLMQEGDAKYFPHGAFLSWENLWHGWGNLQSYALLKSYQIVPDEEYLNGSLKELNNFYEYLLDIGFVNEFKIKKAGGSIEGYDMKKYSQIAYMIRPMVYAAIEAFEITGDSVYAVKAGEYATWFFGNNDSRQQMYFPESGKCFDGINDEDEVNKNSGAESTIEALLSILAVENNPGAKKYLMNYIDEKYIKK
jgi:hypothetical protein